MWDKDHKVNFHQDLYEVVNKEGKVVNKEGKVVITVHRTIHNCYAINSNFRTPLMCSRLGLILLSSGIED